MSINNILQAVFGLNYNQIFLLVCFIIICLFGFFCFIVSIFEIINIKNFLYQYWKKIIIILALPFIIFPFIIMYNGEIVSIDGWLGFIGGYFGLIGAVGAVWWQINEDKKQQKKEKLNLKKTTLHLILNLILEAFNKIDTTKKTIFFNLNPVAKVKGNPKFFLLDEKKLDILLEKISIIDDFGLSYNTYTIHYDIATIERICKEYIVSLGELYISFGRETENLKIEDFQFDYATYKILSKISVIKKYNFSDINNEIFNFYLDTVILINCIAKKYIENEEYMIAEKEYYQLEQYLEIFNNICINIIDDKKRENVLNFSVAFKMMLLQFRNILYGKSSLDSLKLRMSSVLDDITKEINKCVKAVEE